mgnify:CR=1 FL=1
MGGAGAPGAALARRNWYSESWRWNDARRACVLSTRYTPSPRRFEDAGADVAEELGQHVPLQGLGVADLEGRPVGRPGQDRVARRVEHVLQQDGEGLLRASSGRAADDRGRRVRVLLPPVAVVTTRTGAVVVS